MHYPTSWSGTQESTVGMEQLAHGIAPQAALTVVSTIPSATTFAQTPSYRNRIAVTVHKTHIPVHGYPGPDDISFPLAETFADLPATCRAPVFQRMVMHGNAVTAGNVSRSGNLSGHQRIKFGFIGTQAKGLC